MAYRELTGNLFASDADAYVNTVNCVGAMGKGIALEFRRRFPEMYHHYRTICLSHQLRPGQILPYRKQRPWILNFAIKDDWKHPSKIEWIQTCLVKFRESYRRLGIRSVAFPWMGAMNGGLPLEQIQAVTRKYLSDLTDIEIEVYGFDPDAPDPLYDRLIESIRQMERDEFTRASGIASRSAAAIYDVLPRRPPSFTRLIEEAKLGKDSADRIYTFALQLTQGRAGPPLLTQANIFAA
jgi:O-acetyl-ADP-ribose deacetylase (regulator of RNase III)